MQRPVESAYPNESPDYRAARNALLGAEREARRAIERAAALRRRLPAGGALPEDYVFQTVGNGGRSTSIRHAELFDPGKDTLVLYSLMFSADMEHPCPSCASILDSLDGAMPHVTQRVSFAVVARSPIERIARFATARGWRHLRLLSSEANTYNHDYHGETDEGSQFPRMNVFTMDDGIVRHFWGSEDAPSDPGQEPRSLDLFWPLWHLLDVTREGRGTEDFPKLSYTSP